MKTGTRKTHRIIAMLRNVTGTGLKNSSVDLASAIEIKRPDRGTSVITGSDINLD